MGEGVIAISLIVVIIISYLLGSISFSYLIAKKIKKVDIRQHGSGNAGATNTLRVLGIGPAILVLSLDIAKGIVAVWLGHWLAPDDGGVFPALAGFAAIAGHNWPIYFGFRGGKGVATTIGVLATLVFLPALYAGLIAIGSIFMTRYVSLGSILFVIGTPIFMIAFFDYPDAYTYLTLIIAVLLIWRHQTNIKRLVAGEESKIGQKNK
ncbi:glycerol-3-phosphate 1-O-acyltransferase PlsY [Halalkalibacter hemicellulosilyticus]|uniref:Glycerol-3-phosphate acyltransferase n=1 Tax=Halalkalibacter hemicellulosilyticusJCM 9152 TaxID=1236971 RepID=W4QAL1_9BACI|nr:glycerol-3-phosphate 1-O-acyltransferase PlsY [Halalkalibacter hemicellulosilyticus]GAE29002.1 acyl-phosphate:glycerol-3-phosphate O-acyltransferase PlsY [Halalkalibacter hemicellulosilyticusJCM 9152]